MTLPPLTYRGDLVNDLFRRVLGPDTAGGHVVVDSVSYNRATDRTTAHCRPLRTAETELVQRDQFGQLVLPMPQGEDD